jgi:hypothetical protein
MFNGNVAAYPTLSALHSTAWLLSLSANSYYKTHKHSSFLHQRQRRRKKMFFITLMSGQIPVPRCQIYKPFFFFGIHPPKNKLERFDF